MPTFALHHKERAIEGSIYTNIPEELMKIDRDCLDLCDWSCSQWRTDLELLRGEGVGVVPGLDLLALLAFLLSVISSFLT